MAIKNALIIIITIFLLAMAVSAQTSQERFVLMSHAPDSDSWWNTIKNAVKEASQTMQVQVEYCNPSTGGLADTARIIEQAKASGVNQFLCVNHYITNPASVERCQGYADAIGTTLTKSMIDSSQYPSSIEKK